MIFFLEIFWFVCFKVWVKFSISQIYITVPVNHESVSPHEKGRWVQFIVHRFAYLELHLLDFDCWVAVVSGLGKITWTQGLKFLKFCSNKHGSSSGQLKIRLGKVSGFLEVLVSKRHSQVVSLSLKSKLITYMHHPIDKNRPHEPIQIFLSYLNVVWLYDILCLPVFQTNYCLDFGCHVNLWLK